MLSKAITQCVTQASQLNTTVLICWLSCNDLETTTEHHSEQLGKLVARLLEAFPAFFNGYDDRIHTGVCNLTRFQVLNHGGINRPEPGTGIKLHFQDSKGNPIKTVEANEGDDILAIAHEYDIDLEACSTCHVILPEEQYDLLPEPDDDENDMLDMAFGLTDTSRLGCQVKITKELDGMTITLPSATRNMFVDGHTPTRH
ncbi:adrenodoxin-type ferredoxin [Coprinopsis cinerea okayama7|uniref:Adrenodoxin-type ferredoxin n=1 Tax=Coprinopsis cinerea (strain Okayama-7 / 130 / ATCC MYA-4618 / FGSC 9003) TaxID=240176 RepID=A8PH33_COPC7|nr:adrenodoxin-type ferredoxin [Coprinopsis cinerea okayama7\|eukprot:XP_001841331.2 adrenodoxin-type ferredoxin [Coprinopsis cinerea okayama7\